MNVRLKLPTTTICMDVSNLDNLTDNVQTEACVGFLRCRLRWRVIHCKTTGGEQLDLRRTRSETILKTYS